MIPLLSQHFFERLRRAAIQYAYQLFGELVTNVVRASYVFCLNQEPPEFASATQV